MPSRHKTKLLLERHVSKVIIRYIDSAITSPPKHHPFQHDGPSFTNLFSSFWKEDFIGINLEDVYERKPDDPPWLSYYSDYAINSVRLVLAVRERDMQYLPMEEQPVPLADLATVALKNLSRETFCDILRGLDKANKQLERSEQSLFEEWNPLLDSLSKESYDLQDHNRFYKQFKLASGKLDMYQQYIPKSDDPDWLAKFSNQAINIVRLAVLIRAHHQALLSSPLPDELLLDTITFTAMSLEEFLNTFPPLVEAAKRIRSDEDDDNNRNTLIGTLTQTDSGTPSEDERSEPFEDADDLHTSSEVECGSDLTLNDWQSVDEEVVEFDSEEELRRQIQTWSVNESLDDLPEDVVRSLLYAPKTRKTTVTILRRTLGVQGSTNEAITKDFREILRELRREYRIAHTPPLPYRIGGSFSRSITPLIHRYLALANSSYALRSHCRPIRRMSNTTMASNLLTDVDMIKRNLMGIADGLKGFTAFKEVMYERVNRLGIRLDVYQDTISYCMEIDSVLIDIYSLEAPAHKRNFANLQHEHCRKLWIALEVFVQFDEATFDKQSFQEFPGCLVKACGILSLFKEIIDLKYLPSCATDGYLLKSVGAAKELHKKWLQRSINSENSLYVNL